MAELWKSFSTWFWNPDVWTPQGYDWNDFAPNEKTQFTNWDDLWSYPFYMAAIATALRFLVLNPLLYAPIAKRCGFKDIKVRPVVPNKLLEKVFWKHKGRVPCDVICESAKVLEWTERKVERWLRQRRSMKRVSRHTKFMECSWQLTYYTFIFFFGLYVMWDKPWLWDIMNCWYNFPEHSLDTDVWWYYMLSLAFYWSMTFTHFFEIRRSDFWEMLLHHLITILLIIFSWTCNLTRVGTLVLIVHDVADIPLQFTKLCMYSAPKHIVDAVFGVFALIWIISRIGIFPLWILRSTFFDAPSIIPMYPVYYIFNGLLVALVCLHIFWTYLIIKIVAESMQKEEGKLEDVRESSADPSELADEDEDEKKEK